MMRFSCSSKAMRGMYTVACPHMPCTQHGWHDAYVILSLPALPCLKAALPPDHLITHHHIRSRDAAANKNNQPNQRTRRMYGACKMVYDVFMKKKAKVEKECKDVICCKRAQGRQTESTALTVAQPMSPACLQGVKAYATSSMLSGKPGRCRHWHGGGGGCLWEGRVGEGGESRANAKRTERQNSEILLVWVRGEERGGEGRTDTDQTGMISIHPLHHWTESI